MKKKVLSLLAFLPAFTTVMAQQTAEVPDVCAFVNPIIGTNGMGHTFPGACAPFGLVQLSPDTDTIPHNIDGTYQKNAYEYCAGYQYHDPTIVGFSHTHLSGTGHSDLGDILIMPATGQLKLNPGRAGTPDEGYRSRFSHDTEVARPGYYEVELADYGIKAQLTATQRVGIHKYTFPDNADGHIILDLIHGIYNYDGKTLWANLRVENDTLLTGYRITNGWARTNYTYFAISLSQPIKDYGYTDKGKALYKGFWRRFNTDRNFPEMTGRKLVAYFNFDTRQNTDMVQSMIRHQQQSVHGMLPVWSLMGNEGWCMSGYHAVSALADAVAKGADISVGEALMAMDHTANVPYYEGVEAYKRLGYVPFDQSGTAASTTLEYAYDDWTIYRTALLAGDDQLADLYKKRANNYRNVFDTSVGFARPRYSNGEFRKEFDAMQTYGEGFIEGNSWNFSFHVPHDVAGLIRLMGGEKKFVSRLDTLFSMALPRKYYEKNEDIAEVSLVGGYVHGNEPSHHIPYLYAWTSQPWKTQYWLRTVMNRMYKNDIDGLGGNDDCGQMSAWYLFTAMGFYPVCPGTDQYVLGAPYLPYIRMNLPNGRTFEIKAPKVSDRNCYVRQVKLNGKVYDKMYITHADLLAGGTLEFDMAASPNKKRGLAKEAKPYSMSEE